MLKEVFNSYINQYIHVSLATTALSAVSYVYFELPFDVSVLVLTFFSTLLWYHFIRWVAIQFSTTKKGNGQQRLSLGVMLIAVVVNLLFISELHVNQILLLIPVGLLTFAYAIPLIKNNGRWKTLRQLPQVKIFVIALTWTLMTVAIPLYKHYGTIDFWVEFIQRFVFIIAITIPFDIRDYLTDPQDLSTLPQKIGVEPSKKTGIILMVLFFMLIFPMSNLLSYGILSELGVFILVLLFLYYTNIEKNRYFTSFWVEATPILWLIDVVFWRVILL